MKAFDLILNIVLGHGPAHLEEWCHHSSKAPGADYQDDQAKECDDQIYTFGHAFHAVALQTYEIHILAPNPQPLNAQACG
ncbi:hypothetical protein [Pseudomonas salmasensis]|uniref:hypothetical protein n=1 Tax=Pseudomonas salmasensis TaxID=2745514 RepID=UPI001645DD01|nr:hypothetical protein [Pseudomonas salmasensis]QXH79020.1 hypothetical protein HU731_004110 [Pseudomonas salmasensis]